MLLDQYDEGTKKHLIPQLSNMYLQRCTRCATKTVRRLMQVQHTPTISSLQVKWKWALTHVRLDNPQEVLWYYLSPSTRHVNRGLGISAHIWCVQVQPHLLIGVFGSAVRQENDPHSPFIQPASQVASHWPCYELSHTPQEPCSQNSLGKQGVAKHKRLV